MPKTNGMRAEKALYMVENYYGRDDAALVDCLADLMHLCRMEGSDFEAALRLARMHLEAELEEEEA